MKRTCTSLDVLVPMVISYKANVVECAMFMMNVLSGEKFSSETSTVTSPAPLEDAGKENLTSVATL